MSRVLLYLSEPGGHAGGIIRGTLQDYREIGEEDSNSGTDWIDAGLNLATGRAAVVRNGGKDKLLLVVAREPCDLVVAMAGQNPDDLKTIPIPVAPEGITSYVHLLGQEIAKVYIRMLPMPDEEPAQPWWRFFWPF